jgi:predicted AlkP superfamily pyrophosphatase or phosphodiesterase
MNKIALVLLILLTVSLLSVSILAFSPLFYKQPSKHGIAVIIIDGFSPDYFNYTPNLKGFKEASKSFTINTVNPPITPAAHASIVSCQPPEINKITGYGADFSGMPYLFAWSEKNNLHACSIYAKSSLGFLNKSYLFYYAPPNLQDADKLLAEKAKEYAETGCDIIIISLPETDLIGHMHGPLSEQIKERLGALDMYWSGLINYFRLKNIRIIVTSDHGMCQEGPGGTHNTTKDCALKIPLIIDNNLTIPEKVYRNGIQLTDILPIICAYYGADCTEECYA